MRASGENSAASLDLLDFVPHLTPRWERPEHLAEIASLFERAEHGEVRAVVSVPPQHGKTETILHGCARYLLRHPASTVAYVSYNADVAHAKSRTARDYALRAGVPLRADSTAVSQWRTPQGGGMLATGVGGPLTSYGVQLLIVDDPHKNREEAESSLLRQRIHEWFTSTALTRVHPGSSVIIVHTRWHEDDLIGRLEKEIEPDGLPAWQVINLPAVNDNDTPLWAKHRPKTFLDRQRRRLGEYDWWALYQGRPRPKGGALFRDVHFYEELPPHYRIAIGVDLAYSATTRSDYSVAVVLAEVEGTYYVVRVVRAQQEAPVFAGRLRQLALEFPGAPMLWHIGGGGERGIVSFMQKEGVPLVGVSATGDKFVRAQGVAAAWNRTAVLIPRGTDWGPDFIGELSVFTGVHDKHDDQVDGLSSAFMAFEYAPSDGVDLVVGGSSRR